MTHAHDESENDLAGTPHSESHVLNANSIDRAAKYLRETMQAGKRLTPWEVTPNATKKKWLALAEGTLLAAGDPQ